MKLKTLKDLGLPKTLFQIDNESYKELPRKLRKDYEKMLEKKRMDFVVGTFNYHSEAELKAEAIKWVNWLNNSKKKWEDYVEFNSSDEFGSGHEGLDYWIKHFFNITEEDLKEAGE